MDKATEPGDEAELWLYPRQGWRGPNRERQISRSLFRHVHIFRLFFNVCFIPHLQTSNCISIQIISLSQIAQTTSRSTVNHDPRDTNRFRPRCLDLGMLLTHKA